MRFHMNWYAHYYARLDVNHVDVMLVHAQTGLMRAHTVYVRSPMSPVHHLVALGLGQRQILKLVRAYGAGVAKARCVSI